MTTAPTPVTFDRVRTMMGEFHVIVFPGPLPSTGVVNLNGFTVTLALLDTVLIVRADSPTTIPADTNSPVLYLAANLANCHFGVAKAAVVNRGETLVMRTERDLPIAAGLTDEQLRAQLHDAIDEVLAGHDAIAKAAEELADLE